MVADGEFTRKTLQALEHATTISVGNSNKFFPMMIDNLGGGEMGGGGPAPLFYFGLPARTGEAIVLLLW